MKITELRITPVAIKDPPLLNSIGVHEPYAIRTILEIETDEGITGIGETYGDRSLVDDLNRIRPLIVGLDPFRLNDIDRVLFGIGTPGRHGSRMSPGSIAERANARLIAAIEVPCLDIQGKALQRPVSDLLGGAVREEVHFASYLFYKFGSHLDFDEYPPDAMGEVLTPEAVVEEAREFERRYGYKSLKLKGGVLKPEVEVETMLALRDAFPDQPMRIDPNAAWTVDTAKNVIKALEGEIEYFEDPVGGLDGMAEIARFTETPLATNMVVVGFETIPESVAKGSCRIILADHHYWGGLRRSRELARICSTFGLGLSMHSNTHLSISLAVMIHFGSTLEEMPYEFDTHQPWQAEEDIIVGGKIPIVGGAARVPDGPGLGVEIDQDALARLHERYLRAGIDERDDVAQMRRYDSAWTGKIPRF